MPESSSEAAATEEATVISDDINLGLITVDGKEFDINELSNAYGEEKPC